MPLNKFNAGVTLLLATNVASFKKDMNQASQSVEGFGASAVNAVSRVHAASQAIQAASIAVGAGMVALASLAANQAMKLETSLNNVATVWDEAGQKAQGTFLDLGDAGEKLIDMSTRLPQSAVQLSDALYDVASSGFQGSDAMIVMEASAKAASAGLSTTEVAARGITTVLNAYAMNADQASHVSDVLFQTVNLGVVTFEELASVMGDFVGMTATAGVSIEEASAALATMTLGGISAAEASTSLNRVMQEFIQPGEALTALLLTMGYESGTAALKAKGLHGILMEIADVVGTKNVEAWSSLFPEIRAVRGVLALVAGDGENYTKIVGQLTDETALYGATQIALAKQAESTSFQLTILKNTIAAIAIDMGQALLPAIKLVVRMLADFAAGIAALPDFFKELLVVGMVVVGTLITLVGLWISNKIMSLLFAGALRVVTTAMTAAGISTEFLTGAINGLKIALGVIGIVLTAASIALAVFGSKHNDAKVDVDALKESLDKETGAVTSATAAWVRDEAVKKGWLDAANQTGISSDDLTKALLGNEDAIGLVNASLDDQEAALKATYEAMQANSGAHGDSDAAVSEAYQTWKEFSAQADILRGGVKQTTKAIVDSTAAVVEDARAAEVDGKAIADLTTASQKEQQAALDRANAHIEAIKAITKEVNAVIDLSAAYKAAGEDAKKGFETGIGIERKALDERGQVRSTALQDQQDAEKRAFERRNEEYQRGLDDRRRMEDTAFEVAAQARKDELDARQAEEKRGLDLVLRTQKNAFDDQLRLQKDAFDDRMQELKDDNDKLIKAENDAWETRKQQLGWNIDDTFGAEREQWKATLKAESDAHDDRVQGIKEAGDKKIRAEGHAFDDLTRTQQQGFDDQQSVQQDALAAKQTVEDKALADDIALTKTGIENRRRLEDQGWTDLIAQDALRMDDRHRAARIGLDKLLQADKDHFDAQATLRSAQHPITMAALQGQIDDQLNQRKQMNADLKTIADSGGEEVNSTVLAKLAELGPKAVALVAASGPDAINKLAKSINEGVAQFDTSGITAGFNKYGQAAATGMTQGYLEGYLKFLASPFVMGPEAADEVRRQLIGQGLLPGFGVAVAPGPPGARAIEARAEGHYAQVAPAGSWRLWAEPETGGEAYIPLAVSKRGRSTSILGQVASTFGYGLIPMAAGGILGGSSGAGGTVVSMPIHVEARVDAGIDMGVAGRVIGDQVERGVRTALGEIERRVVVKAWRN